MPELPPLNSVDWKKMRGNGSLSGPSWSVIARCGHRFLECAQSAHVPPLAKYRQLAGLVWSGPLTGVWAGRQYVVDYLLLAALIAALCVSEFLDPFERSVYHKTDAVGRPLVLPGA